jgi:FXSXX-COOH protein
MVLTDELRPLSLSGLADLRDVPLADMPALGLTVLGRTIDRALLDSPAKPRPVGTFQSSI